MGLLAHFIKVEFQAVLGQHALKLSRGSVVCGTANVYDLFLFSAIFGSLLGILKTKIIGMTTFFLHILFLPCELSDWLKIEESPVLNV